MHTRKGKWCKQLNSGQKKDMVQHPPFQQVITKIWNKCLMWHLRARFWMAILIWNLILLYGACARLNVQHQSAQIANMIQGHSESSASFVEPGAVTSSVIPLWLGILVLLGHGLTFVVAQILTLSVEVGVGIGVTFGMAVGVETRTAGFGSRVMGTTDCDIHWMVVTQVWETWYKPVLMGPWPCIWHCIPGDGIWYGSRWFHSQCVLGSCSWKYMNYCSAYPDFLRVSNVAIGWPA